jgi:glycosyltransferase involved in cell wall biosynthesis
MKVLYIAPRYHTNQKAIIKGWIDNGDEVKFISYYSSRIENYSDIEPVVLGFSWWYNIFDWLYVNIIKRKDLYAVNFKLNHGIPPYWRLKKEILEFSPDLVIIRERTVYSMIAYAICKSHNIFSILYNQSPYWDVSSKPDKKHQYVYRHTPQIRITPVLGDMGNGKLIGKKSYYVPFVVEPVVAAETRGYFKNGAINILCIGKYEPRKNHIMLMKIVKELREESGEDIRLTIIGEMSNKKQADFFGRVNSFYHENKLESFVQLITNVDNEKINDYYLSNDLFVIPSTNEPASVSQLEAMACAEPVICSDTNGTACYVENGKNGYTFKNCNENDLKNKIMLIIKDKNIIIEMGRNAYKDVCVKYTFRNYYDSIRQIIGNYSG